MLNARPKWQTFSITEAILLGIIFFRSLPIVSGLPLIDFYADFVQKWVLPSVYIVLILLVSQGRRFVRVAFLLCLAEPVLVFLFKYSANKAFSFSAFFFYAYLFCCMNLRRSQRALAGRYFLSLVFIISGFQKLNPSFLNGDEFAPATSVILAQIYHEFPSLIDALTFGYSQYWALLTVVGELLIGVLILFWPLLGSASALLFLLAVCFFNQHVNYVVLLTLAVVLEIHPFIKIVAQRLKFNFVFKNPLFWFMAYWLWKRLPYSGSGYVLLALPFLIGLWSSTFCFFFKHRKRVSFQRLWVPRPRWSLFIPAILVILYFIANLTFAPAPTGFSMFSSQSFRHGWYRLDLVTRPGCGWIQKKVTIQVLNDTRFSYSDLNSCYVLTPTQGGLDYTARRVCQIDKDATMTFSSSNSEQKISTNCKQITR